MHRRSLLKAGGLLAIAQFTGMSTLSALSSLGKNLPPSPRMPALFVGHGSPMNAIEQNEYSRKWAELGKQLPRPKAILSISAHWLTGSTKVTTMARPRTIHDFGGFPKPLFDAQYPAPGSPEYAELAKKSITHSHVTGDESWGLDHGTWSVLLPMYPLADIPVFQMSIVYEESLNYHYEIGKELAALREKGVLIIGSGNLVHNLGKLDWSGNTKVFDWAQEFDTRFTGWINNGDHASMLNYKKLLGTTADMAHPSNDHLLPLYYILGMQQKGEQLKYFNEKFDMGSISMKSFIVG